MDIRKTKNYLLIIFVRNKSNIIFAICWGATTFLLLILGHAYQTREVEDQIDSSLKNEAYDGYVYNKFVDSEGRHLDYVEILNDHYLEKFNISVDSIFEKIDVGDYLIKEKGIREIKVIKDHDTISYKI